MAKTHASTKPRALSHRAAIFVREYAKTGNGTRAAIAAGYSPNGAEVTASRLLRVPKIVAALAKLADKTEAADIGDITWLRRHWTAVAKGEVQGPDWKDRIKCSELLGKSLGAFLDRIEHSGKVEGSLIVYMPDNGRG